MNLFTKQQQTHRHRKQTYGYQRGMVGTGEGWTGNSRLANTNCCI